MKVITVTVAAIAALILGLVLGALLLGGEATPEDTSAEAGFAPASYGHVGPVLVQPMSTAVDHHDEVEESLSLTDKEKELIIKSLKKHKGRRRDAAQELGISERTLYRKIKEYDIEE